MASSYNPEYSTVLPSDDSGLTWVPTGAVFAPDLHDGMFQLLTWALGDDGYVYVLSTGFQRDKPVILHRVRPDRLTDPGAYEPWGRAPTAAGPGATGPPPSWTARSASCACGCSTAGGC
ncbi:DUF4185 domain-containing protein [Streptomyces sp. NPDC101112]|uniref:DUF4185 domain-containing protein n=1 Tax=Streptomyces sp. NPDC101112 TaxID=3366105 RepID=UPI0037FB3BE2